jgi:hypothetical protein
MFMAWYVNLLDMALQNCGKKGKSKDHRKKDQESYSERQDNPSWWKKNPSPLMELALPSGAKFQDHFDPGSTKGGVNFARLTSVKHHITKIKLKRNLCAKYQRMGECKPGCNLAHILPAKLPDEAKKEADLAFKEASRQSQPQDLDYDPIMFD